MRVLFLLKLTIFCAKTIGIHAEAESSSSPSLPAHYPNVINANVSTQYEGVLNRSSQWTYEFRLDPLYEKFLSTNVRLEVQAIVLPGSAKIVSITVLQPSAISSSFRIPTFINKKPHNHISYRDYFTAQRTICILDSLHNESIPFSVVLSTKSETDIPFALFVNVTQDFLLELDSTKNFTLSPNRPYYFRYQFNDSKSIDSVRILADTNSTGDSCMTLSVQTAMCPIYDQEESIYFEGYYQTIRSSGAIFVEKKYPFESGFVLVILAHPDDEECRMRDPLSVPRPHLYLGAAPDKFFSNISVSLKIINDELEYPNNSLNALCWTLPILLAVAICVGSWVALKFKYKSLLRTEPQLVRLPEGIFWSRLKSNLYISDFGKLGKTGNGFFHFVTVMGTFYAIPVCQFAVYYYMV
ncbi:SID1 transmembrane family member 1 [Orchesella cincta]|uniref:SID1 transmembrane family member 1 n=1 Tax=Orchesella cincta TaxID=48709 RepID=A0A1D2M292_ORCCI|nr:SID1 transmembrane family member 1 [Orchesella cincta]